MKKDYPSPTQHAQPLKQLPLRLHHRAIVVKDQGATRHFMEDILGLPLVACWTESTPMPEVDRPIEYCHTFFALGDGSAIAFFQFTDEEFQEKSLRRDQPEIPRFDHLAIKATRETQNEVIERLEKHGVKYITKNHGYCKSVYVTTPDGLYIEFAEDPPYADEIDKVRRADAHEALERWLNGDTRTTNNPYRFQDF
ncbi:VOC family protein [Verticiella sediminum]|uniref:VOC family protein n=1 Tax=Verticiella sediminum TaxID=1247510 RepID=A0A556ACH3_9BURK|nr:VOC family protein [Verticiella sediminum]TSH90585.1 VOC family protein [Verticiella sediminum]